MRGLPNNITMLPGTADLVIIGGGVLGAATAFYAARSGLKTLLLEKRRALGTLTTPVSTGAFRLQFDNPHELALVRRSVALFLDFEAATGLEGYDLRVRQQGYLWLTATEAGAERQRALVTEQHGWGQGDIELLDGAEARHRFPYLAESVRQARFRQGDGFLDPKRLTMGLAAASGAAVALGCPATGLKIESGNLVGVETESSIVETQMAVIAAGPFSGRVAEWAGLRLPIRTVRRHKLILPDVPEVPAGAPMTIDEDTGAHWRPGLRGAFLLYTDPQAPASEPAEDVPTDHRFYNQLLDPESPTAAARMAPFWRRVWERNVDDWILQAGQYTETPDHRPLIGESEVGGLWMNTGYSGHGIAAGPGGSRLLVQLMMGEISAGENPFRPDRAFEARKKEIL